MEQIFQGTRPAGWGGLCHARILFKFTKNALQLYKSIDT